MSVRKLKSGKYQIDVLDVQGHRVRRNFRLKATAEAREREIKDAREKGERWSDAETFNDLWRDFEQVHKPSVRAQTWSGYLTHWVKHIQPDLGGARVHRFEQPDAQAFVTRLQNRGVMPVNAQRVFATLSLILGYGASEGRSRVISKRHIRFGRTESFVPVVPTVAEAEAVYAELHPYIAVSVPLAIYGTLRWGECFGLNPLSIMWERRQIHVNRVLERRTGLLVDDTKGGRRGKRKTRFITMPDRVYALLREHVAEFPDDYLVFHYQHRAVSARWFHDRWEEAVRRAGTRWFTYHGLRHAAVGVMVDAGWTVKQISEEMGHASAAFTLDRYSWLFNEDATVRRDALNGVIAAGGGAVSGGVPQAGVEPARREALDLESSASASSATGASGEHTAP